MCCLLSLKITHSIASSGTANGAADPHCMSHAEVCGAVLFSELFNWVLEPKRITVDQAMRCAKREPGRSWEAIESELNKLGEPAASRGPHHTYCYLT